MAKCKDNPLHVAVDETDILPGIRIHGLLIALSFGFMIIGSSVTAYLAFKHATNYTNPKQQKQIIRILLIVPVYTVCCTAGTILYRWNVYFSSVYEFYESLAISAFFLLLCQYLHDDISKLSTYFSAIEPRPWILLVRFFMRCLSGDKEGRTKSGSRWFKIIWMGVFQFCVIKLFGATTKCITEALDVYCSHSNNAKHAKLWVMIIEIFSVFTAMMCLLQFFKQNRKAFVHHQAVLKFLAIKLVVFLFYVQSFIFDQLLKEDGDIKPSKKVSYSSWAVGIQNTILAFEMAVISILHIWAYPYTPYKSHSVGGVLELEGFNGENQTDGSPIVSGRPFQATEPENRGGVFGWRVIRDVLDLMDIVEAVVTGFRYMFGS